MNAGTTFPLLSKIENPADLRALPAAELETLASELRQYLIETVSQMGGHFAASASPAHLARSPGL